jgi:hypothetical protein
MANTTNWSAVNNFDDMLVQANNNAPFWTMIVFMIWAVLSITFMPFGTNVALITGGFIAGLIGIFLVYMNLVAWKWVLMMFAGVIALVIIETLWAKKEN